MTKVRNQVGASVRTGPRFRVSFSVKTRVQDIIWVRCKALFSLRHKVSDRFRALFR